MLECTTLLNVLITVINIHRKEINMKRVIEIRAAEGGEDAKLFTRDLAKAYTKLFDKIG